VFGLFDEITNSLTTEEVKELVRLLEELEDGGNGK